ncbi:hypothetical protein [Actinoplanes sp. NPDC051411]|uniref:hypothetical protein n=1 Tax=Actinoplanes sp. NPDC051411 TaxID=3155522 RepID=UPI00343543F5
MNDVGGHVARPVGEPARVQGLEESRDNPSQILDAAVAIVDRDGLKALTMRGLGAALDAVETMLRGLTEAGFSLAGPSTRSTR